MKCILVVDDNSVLRRTLRQILEQHDEWTVCGEAVDGVDAIEKAKQLHPDLVVLDLSMPRMDGLQAGKELRRLMPEVSLILFTVFGNTPQVTKEAHDSGIDTVVSKVDGIAGLVSSVQSALA
ncbi:MAG TPA: response regulator transcription factor [Terriglobales bacterium]